MAVKQSSDGIVEEMFIAAPPEDLFAALTEPEQLLAWWGDPRQYWCTSWTADLRVGGSWRSEGRSVNGRTFVVDGTYVEIDPPRVLSFTWNASWTAGPVLTVRITLEPREGGTWLVWTMTGFGSDRAARDVHSGGLPQVVEWLRTYIASRH